MSSLSSKLLKLLFLLNFYFLCKQLGCTFLHTASAFWLNFCQINTHLSCVAVHLMSSLVNFQTWYGPDDSFNVLLSKREFFLFHMTVFGLLKNMLNLFFFYHLVLLLSSFQWIFFFHHWSCCHPSFTLKAIKVCAVNGEFKYVHQIQKPPTTSFSLSFLLHFVSVSCALFGPKKPVISGQHSIHPQECLELQQRHAHTYTTHSVSLNTASLVCGVCRWRDRQHEKRCDSCDFLHLHGDNGSIYHKHASAHSSNTSH